MPGAIDETTPLLYAPGSPGTDPLDASIDNRPDIVGDDESSSITAEKELSNARLALILGSIWV